VGRRLSRISSQSHSQQRAERQRAGSADSPAAGKRLHTFRDLADLTQLSIRTLQREVAAGRLRYLRFGRQVRFRDEDVEVWMKGASS
jgi:excisionase family DNA binding protein